MEVLPYITPPDMCLSPLIFIPSDDAEILCFELYTGVGIARLRGMELNTNGRVVCVAGRSSHQVFLCDKYADGQELYSGAVDAEVGVWQSKLTCKPIEMSSVSEKTLKGQEILRDIYKAFIDLTGDD
jgi:hypothetical protein